MLAKTANYFKIFIKDQPIALATKIELIVIDGMSNDDTYQLSDSFLNASLFIWLFIGTLMVYNAMNSAPLNARAPYVTFINSGDVILDEVILSESINILDSKDHIHAYQTVVGITHPGWSFFFSELEAKRVKFAHQGLIYRRYLHDLYDVYDETLKIAADELFMNNIDPSHVIFTNKVLVVTYACHLNTSRYPRNLFLDSS